MKGINNNKKKNTLKNIKTGFMFALIALLFSVFGQSASANLMLDTVQFDPAIIASGDEVDIVVQFHDEALPFEESKIGDSRYTFQVKMESDDDITAKYIEIVDSEGDDQHGRIYSGGVYNKVFRVKVKQDAPAGSYEFKLNGLWYKDGEPVDSVRFLKFKMPVKREGIILDLNSIITEPGEVRPGDDFVKLKTYIENVGEKDAKSISVKLELPEGMESSYSNDNRIFVGRLNAGESKEIVSYVNLDEDIEDKQYFIKYEFEYMDLDNNINYRVKSIPFLVKPRPYIDVIGYEGESLTGETGVLKIFVKNVGGESAESVDVRILKQNSQPFDLDVRSDYIGELEPGEEGVAMFEIKTQKDAAIKEHDFKVFIRSKGDSDKGDDNIYTYNRRAKYSVTGTAPNTLAGYGGFGALMVLLFVVVKGFRKEKK